MAEASNFGMRPRILHEDETRNSLSSWIDSLLFYLSTEPRFSRYLDDLSEWQGTSVPHRGFRDDVKPVDNKTLTATNKATNLKIMLAFIAVHCPVISSSFVKEEANSLDEIFNRLREHFDCAKSGAKITEILNFRIGTSESRESLWEKVYSYFEDNLVTRNSGIMHQGRAMQYDETFSPTLLNIAVIIWLNAIHPGLPGLVKQRFAIPLRNNTIYSMRTEISDSIPSLLIELSEREGVISYTRSNTFRKGRFDDGRRTPNREKYAYKTSNNYKTPKCCLCEAAKRPGAHTHFLKDCPFLPPSDRKYLFSRVGDVEVQSESDDECEFLANELQYTRVGQTIDNTPTKIARVDILSSPSINIAVNKLNTHVILDTGAESNLIREDEAQRLGLAVLPTSHRANMADGKSPMAISGEVHFQASLPCSSSGTPHSLNFDGLVVKNLNCSVLGGMPFLENNDIFLRPKINSVFLGDCCNFQYVGIRRCSNVRAATILRVTKNECILPGASLTIPVPNEFNNKVVSVEPRCESYDSEWVGCRFLRPEDGFLSIENNSQEPVLVKRHTQLCQIRHTQLVLPNEVVASPQPFSPSKVLTTDAQICTPIVNPHGILSLEDSNLISSTNELFKDVFSASIGCYNGASGSFYHRINMSTSLPPQRRGRVPMYSRNNLEILQMKFDELYEQGVFIRPEEASITAEYVSPSFLVAKPAGGHRLVTAFTEIGQYSKPQPSVMPKVDDIIRQLATFKYLIKADLTQAYYQIPLDRSSLKYVGVCTPFKGVYVYTRAVMGLPGSESALEQLLCKVLGDLMVEGSVIKLADDLYIGGDSPKSLNHTWHRVLSLLSMNNLRLSPTKTVCCPASTEVLGWQWKQGTLSATSHRLNALSSCERPRTVKGLRSFVGSYKFLSRVLPRHSDVLDPLEKACAGEDSKNCVVWSESLVQAFENSKSHLKEAKVLTLPRPEDKLQIVTDASTTSKGLASTLIVIRDGKPLLGGVFNAKKTTSQAGWLACELEALGIAASIRFFGPYLIQSQHPTEVLTDSKPCVQAYHKFMKGNFSTSPRVATFLSTISRYQVKLSHISGSNNTFSDYLSRNSLQCNSQSCQICSFILEIESSVVNNLSVSDILSGQCSIPFTTRSTWLQIQRNCLDLKHVYTLLRDGRAPSRKQKGLTDVKRYLNYCKLSNSPADGLIIVPQEVPLQNCRQKIVVPRSIVDGLLTALHLQLRHPSKFQLKQVFCRAFFALDIDPAIARVVDGCHSCASLKKVPLQFREQSTSLPDSRLGSSFAGDIINREGQSIFIIRENLSSLTDAVILPNESTDEIRNGLVQILSRFRPLLTFKAVVRLDGQSSFQSLQRNCIDHMNVVVEIGDAKNINRNPIAERSIEEFHEELCKLKPEGGKISNTDLSMILSSINSRVRQSGFSAIEMWTQRDMLSGDKLTLDFKSLSEGKYRQRTKQHLPSARYKSRGLEREKVVEVSVGDIVYLIQDRDKTRSRSKYIVTRLLDQGFCLVCKFTTSQFRGKNYRVKSCDLIKVPILHPTRVFAPRNTPTNQFNLRNPHSTNHTNPDNNSSSSSSEQETDYDTPESDNPNHDSTNPSTPDHDKNIDSSNAANLEPDKFCTENSEGSAMLRRPSRTRRPPPYLQDFELGDDPEQY